MSGRISAPPVAVEHWHEYGPYGRLYEGPVEFKLPLLVCINEGTAAFNVKALLVDAQSNDIMEWLVYVPPNGCSVKTYDNCILTLRKFQNRVTRRATTKTVAMLKSLKIAQSDNQWVALQYLNPMSNLSHVVFAASRKFVATLDGMNEFFTTTIGAMSPYPNNSVQTTFQSPTGINVAQFYKLQGKESHDDWACRVLKTKKKAWAPVEQLISSYDDVLRSGYQNVLPTVDEIKGPLFEEIMLEKGGWTEKALRMGFYFMCTNLVRGNHWVPWIEHITATRGNAFFCRFLDKTKLPQTAWVHDVYILSTSRHIRRYLSRFTVEASAALKLNRLADRYEEVVATFRSNVGPGSDDDDFDDESKPPKRILEGSKSANDHLAEVMATFWHKAETEVIQTLDCKASGAWEDTNIEDRVQDLYDVKVKELLAKFV
jgi:hypothetical protein